MQAGGSRLVISLFLGVLLAAPALHAHDKDAPKEKATKKDGKTRTPPPKPPADKPTGKGTPPEPPKPPKVDPKPPKPPDPQKPPTKPDPQKTSGSGQSGAVQPSSATTPPDNAAASASSAATVTAIGKELLETRSYRRDAAREEIWRRWGDATRNEAVRQELSLHGRRAARLRHVLRLAVATSNRAAADKADALLNIEDRRHERAMLQLSAAAGGTQVPAGVKP